MVFGGVMIVQEVVRELEWSVPGDYHGDLRPAGWHAFNIFSLQKLT
jgi:hypothetical protein